MPSGWTIQSARVSGCSAASTSNQSKPKLKCSSCGPPELRRPPARGRCGASAAGRARRGRCRSLGWRSCARPCTSHVGRSTALGCSAWPTPRTTATPPRRRCRGCSGQVLRRRRAVVPGPRAPDGGAPEPQLADERDSLYQGGGRLRAAVRRDPADPAVDRGGGGPRRGGTSSAGRPRAGARRPVAVLRAGRRRDGAAAARGPRRRGRAVVPAGRARDAGRLVRRR